MKRHAESRTIALAILFVGAALFGCERAAEEGTAGEADTTAQVDTTTATDNTLYDRLGGEAAIRSVVDTLVARAAADDTLNFTRAGTPGAWEPTPENLDLLKVRLVQFVSSATGGPQSYEGEDMATAHAGMEITDDEFDRLARHLVAALDAHQVPHQEQQELLAIVETTRSTIVTETAAR